jgi:hypothetical protein
MDRHSIDMLCESLKNKEIHYAATYRPKGTFAFDEASSCS